MGELHICHAVFLNDFLERLPVTRSRIESDNAMGVPFAQTVMNNGLYPNGVKSKEQVAVVHKLQGFLMFKTCVRKHNTNIVRRAVVI